jgi:hypothetical protein
MFKNTVKTETMSVTVSWIQMSNTCPAYHVLETQSTMCMKYQCTVHQVTEFSSAYILKQFGPYFLNQSTLDGYHHLVFHLF